MKARIHVNRHNISRNKADGGHRPIYTIKIGGRTVYAQAVEITGPSRLIDPRTTKPLACGAQSWIETDSPLRLTDPCSYEEGLTMVGDAA